MHSIALLYPGCTLRSSNLLFLLCPWFCVEFVQDHLVSSLLQSRVNCYLTHMFCNCYCFHSESEKLHFHIAAITYEFVRLEHLQTKRGIHRHQTRPQYRNTLRCTILHDAESVHADRAYSGQT